MRLFALFVLVVLGQCAFADCRRPLACNEVEVPRQGRDVHCVFSLYIIEGAKQRGISLAESIACVTAAGIKAIDVGLDEVAFARQMIAAGMHVESVYGDVRFLDPDNGEKSGEELLAAAKSLGSPRIMVLPQLFPENADQKACMRRTIDGLRKLVAKAKAAGVVTTVENYDEWNSPCASIVRLKEMFEGVPDLRFTLDAGNFYVLGAKDSPVEALEMFRDRIVHCHVKDYRSGEAGKWCALGKGCIPNERIVRSLLASGYAGYFTLEETAAPDFLSAVENASQCLSTYIGNCSKQSKTALR